LQSFLAILQLLVREEWRGRPGDVVPDGAGGAFAAELPPAEIVLVTAAAALNAGEPKRALAILDGSPPGDGELDTVARALRIVATSLDRNWFPGGAGAVLEAGDVEQLDAAPMEATTAEAWLLVVVASRLVAMLPNWRSLVSGSRRGSLPLADPVLTQAWRLVEELRATRVPEAIGPAALALADLFVRAGQPQRAAQPLWLAMQAYQAARDPVGLAACELVRGDWSGEPLSHPELLGEDLEGPVPTGPEVVVPDPGFAAERYREAETRFAAAGAIRGVAAVALRRAGLAVAAGTPADARSLLEDAHALAEEAGDGALARLTSVHRALAAIEAGDTVAPDPVADEVGTWATSVGSTSFARGLARLCHARGRRLRDHDVLRGRQALLIAEGINQRVGGEAEAVIFGRERAELYVGANYRRAALLWTMLDLEQARQRPDAPLDEQQWAGLVDRAMRANAEAGALMDPAGIERVREYLGWLAGRRPQRRPEELPELPAADVTEVLQPVIEQAIAEAAVLIPLYRGTTARAEGDLDEAQRFFEQALAAARGHGESNQLLEAYVLGTMQRREEAVAIVEPLAASGQLPPDAAASLFVRLRRFDLAVAMLDTLAQLGGPPPGDRPWEAPARQAEVLLGAGDPAAALPPASEAIDRFEQHLTRLSRDVLRTMASDDFVVAGLYTTAVRAHVALAVSDPRSRQEQLSRAFQLSDRCRGSSLADLVDLDRAAGTDPAIVGAVRTWQRAGATLAYTIEQLADLQHPATLSLPTVRGSVLAAERALDDAEAALAAASPTLLSNRRLPPTPPLSEIQDQLQPGTLLLQYHAFDDELIAWAVTSQDAQVTRNDAVTSLLTAQVRRFHRNVASRSSSRGQREDLGRTLAGLLLDPFVRELEDHERVVLVPHGPLAVLPFHLLPHDRDVLAASHVVSYLPAASILAAGTRELRVGGDAEALVVGDPAYAPGRRLRRLPGAGIEAVAVARLRDEQALVGSAANRDAVLTGIDRAHVVHLATHGLLREGAPYSAELTLAGDESLTVPDLMGLDTTVDLAVLSACDSGRGRATAAGDMIGLTRALLAAGVHHLVVSLWPVDDQLACLAMVRFHEELLGGRPPAWALATAQRALRAMSRPEADDRYLALQGEAGIDGPLGTRSARDLGMEGTDGPSDDLSQPGYWAPFVHVGA
jgi:CHAT domain-containing protein